MAIPYISHISVPDEKSTYMYNEMADVSFVRMVFMACGKKEDEVKTAAIKPITEVKFISNKIYDL